MDLNFDRAASKNAPPSPENKPPEPAKIVDREAFEKARQERAFKNGVTIVAGKIEEMAVKWGLKGGDIPAADVAEMMEAVGKQNVADKHALMNNVAAKIEALPNNTELQKKTVNLSRTLLKRLNDEMFVNLDEDEDLPLVTGKAA